MHPTVLYILAGLFSLGLTICPSDVVERIQEYWNGNPPSNITSELRGIITWLTAPPFIGYNLSEVECMQTHIDLKKMFATDVITFRNSSHYTGTSYSISENDEGIILLKGDIKIYDENLYIISLKNDILIYYQCEIRKDEYYKGFAGLAAVNLTMARSEKSYVMRELLSEAYYILESLNLVTLEALRTNCGFNTNPFSVNI